MKRLAGLSALALILTSTPGCGWLWGDKGYFRDRGSDYLADRQAPAMQVPPDVSHPKRLDPLLPIPRNVADSSVAGEYTVPRPQPLSQQADSNEFSLQKSGGSQWIVALRPPAEVWPAARQFFEDSGFRITDERPQTGEFSTAWQRSEDLAPAMAKRLGGNRESRVRVRVEPGVQRNTSEVFVTSVERQAGSGDDVAFPEKSVNQALDGALLDEMLAGLVRGSERGSVSLLAARDFDAPSRVSLSEDGSGNPVLSLGADFDRAWSSVGRSLDNGNIRIDDLNRSLGLYYINLAEGTKTDEKPGFWARLWGSAPSDKELEARAERYQVRLTSVAGSVQVTVEKDINTVAPADVARRVLSIIQEHLG